MSPSPRNKKGLDVSTTAVEAATVQKWLDGWAKAWKTNAPEDVSPLFSEDVYFRHSGPFGEVCEDRESLVAHWIRSGAGDEKVSFTSEILDINGQRAIIRVSIQLENGGSQVEEDGIYMPTFNDAGECTDFWGWVLVRRDGVRPSFPTKD